MFVSVCMCVCVCVCVCRCSVLTASVRERERAREIEFALWGQSVWVRVCKRASARDSVCSVGTRMHVHASVRVCA